MFTCRIHLISALGALALLLTGLGVVDLAAPPPANAAATHRVLITGDSITQGSSGDYTWRYRLWTKLGQTDPGDVAFVGPRTDLYDNVNNTQGSQHYAAAFAAKAHGAVWGTTYLAQLDQIASQVSNAGANVLVVQLGFNDLAYHTTPAQTIANARTYIQRARNAAPGLDVVIGEVTHRYDFFGNTYELTTQTSQYASLLAGVASDMNTSSERVVVAHTKNGWDPKVHTWDGVHPNSTGETLIAQRVSEALAQLGAGTSSPNIFQSTAWAVKGPSPTVTTGMEKATIAWSRVSTGSTAMFVNYRITNNNQTWQQLPYAVFETDYWTMEPLAAGGTYQFATRPSKGFMTGYRGPEVQKYVDGHVPGLPSNVSSTSWGYNDGGAARVRLTWTPGDRAQGTLMAYKKLSFYRNTGDWEYLPYAVSGDGWTVDPLLTGRYFDFQARSSRGFLTSGWALTQRPTRTTGLAPYIVYAVLGDSYSSGNGRYALEENYDDTTCWRADDSWSSDVIPSFIMTRQIHACSGSRIVDVLRDQVNDSAIGFLEPHDAEKRPLMITVTAGGNDAGFRDKLIHCFQFDCSNKRAEWEADVDAVGDDLDDLFLQMRRVYPYTDITAGGYPAPISEADCVGINDSEAALVRDLTRRLNDLTEIRAGQNGVWGTMGGRLQSTFNGHGGCSDDPWIWPFDAGLTANSFHPGYAGHLIFGAEVSDAIIDASGYR